MKIVILDGETLNPGDLSWENLAALGDLTVHDRTEAGHVVERAQDAELVLLNKVEFTAEILANCPKLAYIGVLATGYNVVAVEAMGKRGIPVSNIPTYGTKSVAQMVFAHLLELTQNIGHHAQTTRSGRWSESADWCYWDRPLIELEGLTMGIVGFGRIGQAVGRLAHAFGMRVLAHDVMPPANTPDWATMSELEPLFRESDVVSLHCPLFPGNHEFVNKALLAQMKENAFLINTSRGPLINEGDLADALNAGRIAGAGIDVLSTEPPNKENPLLTANNCFVTPHIAWATKSARSRLMDIAVDNVRNFLDGHPQNVVNIDAISKA